MKDKPIMNKSKILAVAILILSLASSWGQQAPGIARPASPPVITQDTPALTRFNLDFAGGSPQDLVAAIQKATGKPLNAIINDDDRSSTSIPPLKMNNVDVHELFAALTPASSKIERIGNNQFQNGYGFRTDGVPTDDSVWYFFVERPVPKLTPPSCRFYLLTPYLERGLTVDDITTAIQTAWKMSGYGPHTSPAPQISYHKETKLLIAVGEPSGLETIDAVLKALEPKPLDTAGLNSTLLKQYLDLLKNSNSTNSKPSNINH
jgi:hypothetical protein